MLAQGKMTNNNECLREFTNMGNKIKAEKCGVISHVEVPLEILRAPGTKIKVAGETSITEEGAYLWMRDRVARTLNANTYPTPILHTQSSYSINPARIQVILLCENL